MNPPRPREGQGGFIYRRGRILFLGDIHINHPGKYITAPEGMRVHEHWILDEKLFQQAARLAEGLGFEAVDAGPLAEARSLEYLGLLWIHLAYLLMVWPVIAFKLLRR